MLYSVFLGLAGFFQTRDEKSAVTDDFTFRLFYGFTSGILFLCTTLVGLQEISGKNIDCYSNSGAHPKAASQYCWVSGTKHILGQCSKADIAVTQHFEDMSCFCDSNEKWTDKFGNDCSKDMIHSYYQWVPYVLMLQGVLFYLPRLFWLKAEEGKMSKISDGIRAGTALSNLKDDKVKNVADNVANYLNMREAGHKRYGLGYIFAHVLNQTVLIFVVWFTNIFLDGNFYSLGHKWFQAARNETAGSKVILDMVFPTKTQCDFFSYGGAGPQKHNYWCLLAPNIVSEKIFVFLWFWYAVLSAISAANFAWIALMAICKNGLVRRLYLMRAVWTGKVTDVMKKDDDLTKKVGKMNFGQFLFLYMLGKNVEYSVYKKILESLIGATLIPAVSFGDNGGIQMKEFNENKPVRSSDSSSLPGYQSPRASAPLGTSDIIDAVEVDNVVDFEGDDEEELPNSGYKTLASKAKMIGAGGSGNSGSENESEKSGGHKFRPKMKKMVGRW